jgi:hypothetical protein
MKLEAKRILITGVAGIARDREEIRIGPVRGFGPLARLAPSLADRIVVRSLRPSRWAMPRDRPFGGRAGRSGARRRGVADVREHR